MSWNPLDWLHLAQFARPMWIVWMVALFLGLAFYALRPRNKHHFDDCALIPLRADSEGQQDE